MKLTYRPEIDGLRSIAVGIVILYHTQITFLGFQTFKGGFIGVDIFFVISGYLITSIILKEFFSTGSFSLKYFYERRIRRILPVLLFVMLVSFPFAWMYLLPNSFIDFSKSILYSLGFSSNFYFHYSDQEYGATNGLLKPYLHTWSLSVEEQYYILFPIVLLITFKYFRNYLIHLLMLSFIISLGLAEWTSRNYPSTSFYFLHTRMWELLAGSILAYFEISNGHRSKNKTLNLILPFIGLLLIGYSTLFFNDKMPHPSLNTLFPIIGVCFIIWFSNKNEIITKILSTKLFVGIGLISYSLYLWHYPIFAFARVTQFGQNNITNKIIIVLSILIFSIVSYYFIEKPFRNKKNNFLKILVLLSISILILISFNLKSVNEKGFGNRFPKIFQVKSKENVYFHQKENTQKVVLIGDSHSQSLEFKLNEEIKKRNLSLFRFNTIMYLSNFNFINKKTKKINKKFIDDNVRIDNFLNENSNLIVLIHHRWAVTLLESFFDNEEGYKEKDDLQFHSYLEPINIETSSLKERQHFIKEALRFQIDNIINRGHKLIIVYPVPELGFNPLRLLYLKYIRNNDLFKNSIPVLSTSFNTYKKRNKLIFEVLDSFKSSDIHKVYPHQFFCNKQLENRCVSNDERNIFYYDDNHLSLDGSKLVVDEIIKEIKKIELESN